MPPFPACSPPLSHPRQGFHFTTNGWVQSYGSRYVRPPIIVSDVKFLHPMTVNEFKVCMWGQGNGVGYKRVWSRAPLQHACS